MSNILKQVKCGNCEEVFKDLYISFGHNGQPIDWEWECEKCNHTNKKEIKPYPDTDINDIGEEEPNSVVFEFDADEIDENETFVVLQRKNFYKKVSLEEFLMQPEMVRANSELYKAVHDETIIPDEPDKPFARTVMAIRKILEEKPNEN